VKDLTDLKYNKDGMLGHFHAVMKGLFFINC